MKYLNKEDDFNPKSLPSFMLYMNSAKEKKNVRDKIPDAVFSMTFSSLISR